jgi:hypothetical protein
MAQVVPLLPTETELDWMTDAECKGLTHLFFAPHGEPAEPRERREAIARSVCQRCEVLLICRQYARTHGELGFWGGENDDERRAARRRMQMTSWRAQAAGGTGQP